jgi:protein transport protein SEC61 subunit gamma-like protein
MSEQLKEIADIPRDFLKDGTLFLNRCTKRMSLSGLCNPAGDPF